MVVLPCSVSGMMMLSSKRSATLRRMLRTSSSGKSTESVSCPVASLAPLATALLAVSSPFTATSGAAGLSASLLASAGTAGAGVGVTTTGVGAATGACVTGAAGLSPAGAGAGAAGGGASCPTTAKAAIAVSVAMVRKKKRRVLMGTFLV